MNEVKVGKLPAVSYTHNFILLLFAQLCKNSTDCFILQVLTVNRFQNRIYIASQEKENKILSQ